LRAGEKRKIHKIYEISLACEQEKKLHKIYKISLAPASRRFLTDESDVLLQKKCSGEGCRNILHIIFL